MLQVGPAPGGDVVGQLVLLVAQRQASFGLSTGRYPAIGEGTQSLI